MLKKWLLLMSVMTALPAAAQDISASNPQLETISGTVVAQGSPDSHPAILGEEFALCLICGTDQPEPSFRRDGTSA
jgi:phosphoenolpyruvate-protein kinase (PTS system EI component)